MKFLIISLLLQQLNTTELKTEETRIAYDTITECAIARERAINHLQQLSENGSILGYSTQCES